MDLGSFRSRPLPNTTYTLLQGCEIVLDDAPTSCWWNGVAFLEALHSLVDGNPGALDKPLDFRGSDFLQKRTRFFNASDGIFEELHALQRLGYDTIENFQPGVENATCDTSSSDQAGVRYHFDIDQVLRAANALEAPGTPDGQFPNSQRVISSGGYVMMKQVDTLQRVRGLSLGETLMAFIGADLAVTADSTAGHFHEAISGGNTTGNCAAIAQRAQMFAAAAASDDDFGATMFSPYNESPSTLQLYTPPQQPSAHAFHGRSSPHNPPQRRLPTHRPPTRRPPSQPQHLPPSQPHSTYNTIHNRPDNRLHYGASRLLHQCTAPQCDDWTPIANASLPSLASNASGQVGTAQVFEDAASSAAVTGGPRSTYGWGHRDRRLRCGSSRIAHKKRKRRNTLCTSAWNTIPAMWG